MRFPLDCLTNKQNNPFVHLIKSEIISQIGNKTSFGLSKEAGKGNNNMSERLSLKKKIWLAVCFVLLATPVFLPSTADSNIIGFCSFILILASYPLNMLFLPFYYLLDSYLEIQRTAIADLYFLMLASSIIGYLQWFVVFPFLLRQFREKVMMPNVQTLFGKDVFSTVKLLEEKQDVRQAWFDDQNRSPFERVMRRDERE